MHIGSLSSQSNCTFRDMLFLSYDNQNNQNQNPTQQNQNEIIHEQQQQPGELMKSNNTSVAVGGSPSFNLTNNEKFDGAQRI